MTITFNRDEVRTLVEKYIVREMFPDKEVTFDTVHGIYGDVTATIEVKDKVPAPPVDYWAQQQQAGRIPLIADIMRGNIQGGIGDALISGIRADKFEKMAQQSEHDDEIGGRERLDR